MDDAINFLDEMETSRNEAWLADLLSSDQIKELYDEARNKGLTAEEANDIIYIEYTGSGKDSDWLYDQVWNAIQEKGAEKEGSWDW